MNCYELLKSKVASPYSGLRGRDNSLLDYGARLEILWQREERNDSTGAHQVLDKLSSQVMNSELLGVCAILRR